MLFDVGLKACKIGVSNVIDEAAPSGAAFFIFL